jgi:eukaryotic-like serine/threonine-protein kinase
LLGTPYYMSPEQALGRTTINHCTDIWAFAVIAFECLTGTRPFESDNLGALLMSICYEPQPNPSQVAEVPAGFDEWFAHAATRDVTQRFQSINEAAQQLLFLCGVRDQSLPAMSGFIQREPLPAAFTTAAAATAAPATVTINHTKPSSIPLRPIAVFAATVLLAGAFFAGVGWNNKPASIATSAEPMVAVSAPLTAAQNAPVSVTATAPSALTSTSASPAASVAPATPAPATSASLREGRRAASANAPSSAGTASAKKRVTHSSDDFVGF